MTLERRNLLGGFVLITFFLLLFLWRDAGTWQELPHILPIFVLLYAAWVFLASRDGGIVPPSIAPAIRFVCGAIILGIILADMPEQLRLLRASFSK